MAGSGDKSLSPTCQARHRLIADDSSVSGPNSPYGPSAPWRYRMTMTKKAFIALACLPLLGCLDATVIDGNVDGVWLKQPLIGSGNVDSVAERFCARFKKKAVYKSTLHPEAERNYFRPILAYDCD